MRGHSGLKTAVSARICVLKCTKMKMGVRLQIFVIDRDFALNAPVKAQMPPCHFLSGLVKPCGAIPNIVIWEGICVSGLTLGLRQQLTNAGDFIWAMRRSARVDRDVVLQQIFAPGEVVYGNFHVELLR
jgi:hypothetical protein